MENLEERVTFLEKEVADLKRQLKDQQILFNTVYSMIYSEVQMTVNNAMTVYKMQNK
jgi:chaperonin cofactor prefoldin